MANYQIIGLDVWMTSRSNQSTDNPTFDPDRDMDIVYIQYHITKGKN